MLIFVADSKLVDLRRWASETLPKFDPELAAGLVREIDRSMAMPQYQDYVKRVQGSPRSTVEPSGGIRLGAGEKSEPDPDGFDPSD